MDKEVIVDKGREEGEAMVRDSQRKENLLVWRCDAVTLIIGTLTGKRKELIVMTVREKVNI